MMKSYEIDFKEIFDANYEYKFFAPGRVNLIGEHIDYNGGHVLPIAINLGIYALVSERNDGLFSFFSDNYFEEGVITISKDNLMFNKKDGYINYPKAILASLIENGFNFDKGLNVYFYSTLPEQGGVSSSAALEILSATIFNEIFKLKMTPLELAVLARKAVVEHLGLDCGIMDQAAIALGKEKNALFLDTSLLNYEYIPYSLKDYVIVVCQTNVTRPKTNALYKQRVRECERSLDIIKNNFNVLGLCKIPDQYIDMIKNILPDDKLYRRVLHVHNEEKRVLRAKEALLSNDIEALARCINESHQSLRDNFEVSCNELNTIVDLARNEQGCVAARLTGAGFGGCAIALVHKDFLVEFKVHMSTNYYNATGLHGAFFEVDACGGPKRLPKDTDSIYDAIESLMLYANDEHLIEEEDHDFILNQVLALLHLDHLETGTAHPEPLYMILDTILNYATANNLIENSEQAKDMFDTKLMGIFIKRPSQITEEFYKLAEKDINNALRYFYHLARKSNYIREDRISKNIFFDAMTEYGKLEMSINVSRVETKTKFVSNEVLYPKCLICKEAVGYHGNKNYPARQNHRVIPIKLNNRIWIFQYSPYPYFNEHSLLINQAHTPLKISRQTFENMVSFVNLVPDYFIGTNADLPIVGGGILNHEHYHTGRFHFPVEDATSIVSSSEEDMTISILKWPMSVIRIESKDSNKIVDKASTILNTWSCYDDLDNNIISNDTENHNAITPILRKNGDTYQMYLFLRNNRVSEKYPLGIFHPHQEYLHIKKENIGLFEAMGFAVLPKSLKEEIYIIKQMLLKNDVNFDDKVVKHKEWVLSLQAKYQFTNENITEIFHNEIGNIFLHMLDDCAVFKQNEKGLKGFKKFLGQIK